MPLRQLDAVPSLTQIDPLRSDPQAHSVRTPNRLKLTSLKYVSSVDVPAQETAVARLLKRNDKSALEVKATARVAKLSDELGLVFGWALTTKANHVDYIDLQGDNVVEEDLIKVAAEWMSAGGAADTMHDRVHDGGAVFCMPMTYEVAKAFFGDKIGGELGTYGLMVAIKPSVEDFAKFKTGELTGFSIDGMGERTPYEKSKKSGFAGYLLKAAERVVKASLYTNEVDGHQHEVCVCEDGGMYVCYATSAGAENSHSHGIVFENGALTILADSGHSHELADGQPGVAIVPADAIVVVQARAPISTTNPPLKTTGASKSPLSAPLRTVKTQPETKSMNLLKMLALFAAMTPTQQDYVSKLSPDEVEPFFGKDAGERDSILKAVEAADPVVFTGEKTGISVRKSDGDLARKLAEKAELQAVALEKSAEQVTTEKSARELVELTKRANDTLGALAGTDAAHIDILRAVEGITDTAKRDAAIATLKSANAAMKSKATAKGASGIDLPAGGDKKSAYDALSKGLTAFCVEKKIDAPKMWLDGLDAFVATESGAALKSAYDTAE